MNKPRAYDINDPAEIARLYRECSGYLKTCRRHHHGTDYEGRRFAIEALDRLAPPPSLPLTPAHEGK